MSFFVLKAVNPNFHRSRIWIAPKEQAQTNADGTVMCRDILTARLVSTSGFRIVVNPLLGKRGLALREEGSIPVSRAEAAKLLGVSSLIVDTWENTGKLLGYYMGKDGPIFAHDDVLRFAERRKKEKVKIKEEGGSTTN